MGARVTAATKCNSSSSRGHAIFVLTVDTPTTLGRFVHGQFYLCDLAGSEKLKKTEAEGILGLGLISTGFLGGSCTL